MKRLLFATLLLMLVTGCTARATIDMSILQKMDRPNDNWKVENTANKPAPAK